MSPFALDDPVSRYLELAQVADTVLVAHEREHLPDGPTVVSDDQYGEH